MNQQLLLQPRALEIVAYVRKLRGGSQAHLIQADDGQFYAIKAKNNPQHRRILINEWFAAAFYTAAELPVADTAIVNLSTNALLQFPQLRFILTSNELPATGACFGSKWLGDPHQCSTYEFLPPDLLRQIDSTPFIGCLVADQWFCQSDSRQATFTIKNGLPQFRFIDNGFIWNGHLWDLTFSYPGLYYARAIYSNITDSLIGQSIDSLRRLPVDHVFDQAWRTMPAEWLKEDEEQQLGSIRQIVKQRLKSLSTEMEGTLRVLRKDARI
jgi:hypothetical protein